MCLTMEMARRKKMVSFALDPEILRQLDDWIAAQPVPPSKTAVLEAALKKFISGNDDQNEKP